MNTPDDLPRGIAEQHGRAKLLVIALGICSGLFALRIPSSLMQLDLLGQMGRGVPVAHDVATANDARQTLIGNIALLALLVTAVVCLFWMYRAYANLKMMGSKETAITPGWAVGYWFVPVVNLYRPYKTMHELWSRSATANLAGAVAAAPSLIGLWWLCYVGAGLVGRAAGVMATDATELSALQQSTLFLIVSDALLVLAGIIFIILVRQVDAAQQQATAPLS